MEDLASKDVDRHGCEAELEEWVSLRALDSDIDPI